MLANLRSIAEMRMIDATKDYKRFGIPQYVQYILNGLTSCVLLSSLLTVESVDLMVAHDGILCIMKIIHILYFIVASSAFRTVPDLYCCVMG